MADERIIELDTANEVLDDDYLAIDSVSGETRKIKPIKIGATYEIEDGDHEFTLVGSNGYEHTVEIPSDSVSMTQAEYNALTPAQKADGTARFITDAESDVESELWSKVGRQTLDTEAQVLSNAVNELVDKTDETNSDVAELNSSLPFKQEVTVTTSSAGLAGVSTPFDKVISVSIATVGQNWYVLTRKATDGSTACFIFNNTFNAVTNTSVTISIWRLP